MARKTRVKFDAKGLADRMFDNLVAEQTRRLVAYAKDELYEMIASKEFTSRTFNLADSYVWAVYYNKKEEGHGFLGSKMASEKSYLHAWSKNPIPVDGRAAAKDFLNEFKSSRTIERGWTVVWAACAPYSVYLDPAAGTTRTNRFFVISQRYDHIRGTLEPKCKVEFSTNA